MKYSKLVFILIVLIFGYGCGQNISTIEPKKAEVKVSENSKEIQLAIKYRKEGKYKLAKEIFVQEAKNGNSIAQFQLGEMYAIGLGVLKNYKKAEELFLKSAEKNDKSKHALGKLYLITETDLFSHKKASKWLEKLPNNADAVFSLYNIYAYKKSPLFNIELALKKLVRAVELNHDKAQRYLGNRYINGTDIEKNIQKGLALLQKSSEQNNYDAQYSLAQNYHFAQYTEKDLKKACSLYKKLAINNYKSAYYYLATLYENGEGCEQNFEEAYKLYNLAALEDHAISQNHIGVMYEHGKGREKDFKKAAQWYIKAAENGNAVAQNNIGVLYINGNGVEKNYEKAFYWFEKAAKQGNYFAPYNLGNLYRKAQGVKKDNQKALQWYLKSAEQGHSTAQYHVGQLYYLGKGVKKDINRATHWLLMSAKQNNRYAQNLLGVVYVSQKDYVNAVKFYNLAIKNGYEKAKCNIVAPLLRSENTQKNINLAKEYVHSVYKKSKYKYCQTMMKKFKL